jgi:hypothetical protein
VQNEIDFGNAMEPKQPSQMTKTESGNSNDVRPLSQNAHFLIRDNFEWQSNVIETSDWQS